MNASLWCFGAKIVLSMSGLLNKSINVFALALLAQCVAASIGDCGARGDVA
jgi:hypothetical protein